MHLRIPVLMYHEIVPDDQPRDGRGRTHPDYLLPAQAFLEQMQYLAEQGFSALSAVDLVRAVTQRRMDGLPERSVVITFDDGFVGNHHQALPLLRKFGMQATFFVTVAQIGAPAMMSWDQLEALRAAGMGVCSHLWHHVIMAELSREEAFAELFQSRNLLRDRLGQPVTLLSLPNGSYRRDYPELAREAGYLGGFCSRLGYVSAASNPFLLERVPVLRSTSRARFARMAAGDRSVLTGAQIRRQAHTLVSALVGESAVNRWYHRLNRIGAPDEKN
ncbi:MAG TPA: polysaccharide deacetylase family protein [bacterium]|nr:polysaccharide deacetylase family protein [bacterium]HQI47428.1 polysaccharide deacetylase family protein [bacterium]HQJ63842.1 polysaccharide deacetylase family protein [bacterium]